MLNYLELYTIISDQCTVLAPYKIKLVVAIK